MHRNCHHSRHREGYGDRRIAVPLLASFRSSIQGSIIAKTQLVLEVVSNQLRWKPRGP